MKLTVKSSNPVIVNRKAVANTDYLYGFEKDGFVSFDASDSAATMKFQTWYNSNRKSIDPAELVVDGIYGPKTTEAYQIYGVQYDGGVKASSTSPTDSTATPKQGAPKPIDTTQTPKATDNKSAATPGMSTTEKIMIGASLFVGLLLIAIFVNRKKK